MRVRCEVIADHNHQLVQMPFDVEIGSYCAMEIPLSQLYNYVTMEKGQPRIDLQRLEVRFTVLDRRRPIKVTVTQ